MGESRELQQRLLFLAGWLRLQQRLQQRTVPAQVVVDVSPHAAGVGVHWRYYHAGGRGG